MRRSFKERGKRLLNKFSGDNSTASAQANSQANLPGESSVTTLQHNVALAECKLLKTGPEMYLKWT